jgi:hypothetical protein
MTRVLAVEVARCVGGPRIPAKIRQLIAETAVANRTWGEERLASQLLVKVDQRPPLRTMTSMRRSSEVWLRPGFAPHERRLTPAA